LKREQTPYRTAGRADRLIMRHFDVLPLFLIEEANPYEGMRLHHSGSKSLYLIDFTDIFLL
jgi:hypothetical protein